MPTPNITINNNMPSKTGITNDPDFGGLIQADPNLAIRSNTSMTYSRNADGGLYYNSTPEGGGNLLWLWILLGVLGAAALIALLARTFGGNGGGGGNNHYYNYPPQPNAPAPQPVHQPQAGPNGGATPAAPFVQPGPVDNGGGHGNGANQRPGWQGQNVVVIQSVPTGSPSQHSQPKSEPVVVNVHNHYPAAQPNQNPGGRGTKKQTEPEPKQ